MAADGNTKQLDLFGNEVDIKQVNYEKKKGRKETIKEVFRRVNGYDKNHICRNCVHLLRMHIRSGRYYYKCELIGTSSSEATDIRLKDYACGRYEQESEEVLKEFYENN